MSYVPGLEPAYYPGLPSLMLCSGIYDPMFDYGTFIRYISLLLGNQGLNDTIIKRLFDDNLFHSEDRKDNNWFGCPISAPINFLNFDIFFEYEFIICSWSTDQPCNRTLDDITEEYNTVSSALTPQIVDKYIKLLSELHVHYKLEQMKLRQSTVNEFLSCNS